MHALSIAVCVTVYLSKVGDDKNIIDCNLHGPFLGSYSCCLVCRQTLYNETIMLQIKCVLITSIYSGDLPGTFRHKGEENTQRFLAGPRSTQMKCDN